MNTPWRRRLSGPALQVLRAVLARIRRPRGPDADVHPRGIWPEATLRFCLNVPRHRQVTTAPSRPVATPRVATLRSTRCAPRVISTRDDEGIRSMSDPTIGRVAPGQPSPPAPGPATAATIGERDVVRSPRPGQRRVRRSATHGRRRGRCRRRHGRRAHRKPAAPSVADDQSAAGAAGAAGGGATNRHRRADPREPGHEASARRTRRQRPARSEALARSPTSRASTTTRPVAATAATASPSRSRAQRSARRPVPHVRPRRADAHPDRRP